MLARPAASHNRSPQQAARRGDFDAYHGAISGTINNPATACDGRDKPPISTVATLRSAPCAAVLPAARLLLCSHLMDSRGIDSLSDELWAAIFSTLSKPRDLFAAAAVSKACRRAIDFECNTTALSVREFPVGPTLSEGQWHDRAVGARPRQGAPIDAERMATKHLRLAAHQL